MNKLDRVGQARLQRYLSPRGHYALKGNKLSAIKLEAGNTNSMH